MTPYAIPQTPKDIDNMVSRKRQRDEMESSEPTPELSMLDKLRNTWELANLMQYIYIFGKAVKIDEDLTIEVLFPDSVTFYSTNCRPSVFCPRNTRLKHFQLRISRQNVSSLNPLRCYQTSGSLF